MKASAVVVLAVRTFTGAEDDFFYPCFLRVDLSIVIYVRYRGLLDYLLEFLGGLVDYRAILFLHFPTFSLYKKCIFSLNANLAALSFNAELVVSEVAWAMKTTALILAGKAKAIVCNVELTSKGRQVVLVRPGGSYLNH
jgi:hypothetical protein